MPRVREDRRGDDASKVVREVVLRVEAAVPGAVAPPLPAGGTAGALELWRARTPPPHMHSLLQGLSHLSTEEERASCAQCDGTGMISDQDPSLTMDRLLSDENIVRNILEQLVIP